MTASASRPSVSGATPSTSDNNAEYGFNLRAWPSIAEGEVRDGDGVTMWSSGTISEAEGGAI